MADKQPKALRLAQGLNNRQECEDDAADELRRLYEENQSLRAALAEPVQEPFALTCPTPKACREHCCSGHCIPRATSPQQAEPAQRQPLTYEEMLDLISAEGGNNLRIPLALAINLIRATEQAHGIKEAK